MSRNHQHDEHRRQIAKAAIRWIASEGLEKLSQRNIAGVMGRSKGNIQYYFPDKKSLMLGILRQVTQERVERENKAEKAADGASPLHALRSRLVAALPLDAARADEWRARLSLYIYADRDPDMQELLASHAEEVLQAGAELVEKAQNARELKPNLNPRLVFQQLQAAVSGIAISALVNGEALTAENQLNILEESLLAIRN